MKKTLIALGLGLLMFQLVRAEPSEFVDGVFKKVDPEHNKVVIKHNGIAQFNMPAMAMGFKYSPTLESIVSNLQEGDKIKFKVEKNGNFTIVEITK